MKTINWFGVLWVASCCLFTELASAQIGANWSPVGANSPEGRRGFGMAYDGQRARIVVFGGGGNASYADTWERNGSSWGRVTSGMPSWRGGSTMVYIAHQQTAYLFGGSYGNYSIYGDGWTWTGTIWNGAAAPPCRTGHAMTYDSSRSKVIVFGGFGTNTGNCNSYASGIQSETWEGDATMWTMASNSGPSARTGHKMVFDAQRGRTVLFGGAAGTTLFGDTWEWDGTTWIQVSSTGPSPRAGHAMAYDVIRGRTVLFGGSDASGRRGDTWEWDGTAWTSILTSGPSPRDGHEMVFDAQIGRIVLFGGQDDWYSYPAGAWEYSGSAVLASLQPLGMGCAGSAGAPLLSSLPGSLPRPGSTLNLQISNLPTVATVCIGFFGFNNQTIGSQTLPLNLSAYGMPTCTIYTDIYGTYFLLSTTGSSPWSIAIPPVAGMAGTHFYPQALVFDALAGNPANAIMSNAADALIGI